MKVLQKKKLLAVASYGGHWQQLNRLSEFFNDYDCSFITTSNVDCLGNNHFHVPDCNARNRVAILNSSFHIFKIFLKIRPDIVVSTGAAPGLIAIVIAKLMRRKTIWIDSIANAEQLSSSGRMAKRWSDLWLTQWEHLSDETDETPVYIGSVL